MFLKIIWRALTRHLSRKIFIFLLLFVSTVLLNNIIITAFETETTFKKKLKEFGPNFVIRLKPGAQREGWPYPEWKKLFTIFWANNIEILIPVTYTKAEVHTRKTKIPVAFTWWDHKDRASEEREVEFGWKHVSSGWIFEGTPGLSSRTIMLGKNLANQLSVRVGDSVTLSFDSPVFTQSFEIQAIFESGTPFDGMALLSYQSFRAQPEAIEIHEFYARVNVMPDPSVPVPFEQMSPAEQEKWLCRPYVATLVHEMTGALPDALAQPLQSTLFQEQYFSQLMRTFLFVLTLTLFIAVMAGLVFVQSSVIDSRKKELALFSALGASTWQVVSLVLVEFGLYSIIAGGFGWLTSASILALFHGRGTLLDYLNPLAGGLTAFIVFILVLVSSLFTLLAKWRHIQPRVLHEF